MTAARSTGRPGGQRSRPALEIDWTRCDGHGLCASLLPTAIALDDWGYPILDQEALAGVPPKALRRAAGVCPALALRLGSGA